MEESVRKENEQIQGLDLFEWVQALVHSVLLVVIVFTFAARLIGVEGTSMVPTLQEGDRLLVAGSLLYHDYKYGDIVILRKQSFDQNPIVKRVIATEGQTVDIDFDAGTVSVDGVVLDEPYINEATHKAEGTEFPQTVPEGCVFVMGDNRNGSTDSRDPRLGTVDTRYIIGRAVVLAFPGKDLYTAKRYYSRIGLLT